MATVTEYILRANGFPVYSGTLSGARTRAAALAIQAANAGSAEPVFKCVCREVTYGETIEDPTTGEIKTSETTEKFSAVDL